MSKDAESPGEDLYETFVERFFEVGDDRVPDEWPDELRRRCALFLELVRSAPVLDDRFDETATFSVSARSESAPAESAPFRSMTFYRDDRYVIERELARGGMGQILLAHDRDLRRRVAMKVLDRKRQGGRGEERFIEEAQATSQLEHPNIGPVYDIGLDGEGQPFFTMKWIRGRNLEEVIREGGEEFSLLRLVQILQQAAFGVEYAHSSGVVHRDLKPQNVMVGDYGEVLVVDWGLAKVQDVESDAKGDEDAAPEAADRVSTSREDSGFMTLDGSVQGSLPYMAPEQARGDVRDIDARTDVYGLGAILYQILTGAPVHQGGDAAEFLAAARRGAVTPPSVRAPDRKVPRELEEICLKALSARAVERFQTAREFQDGLQSYLERIHDAERRAAEARRLNAAADGLHEDLRRAESGRADAERRVDELQEGVQDHDDAVGKEPLWSALHELAAARRRVSDLFSRTTTAYRAVLGVAPDDPWARERLAEMYLQRLHVAEDEGDEEAARLYADLATENDTGRFRVELQGRAKMLLESEPAGAEVAITRYEERGLLLVESDEPLRGTTPLELELPKGSYLARLRVPGYRQLGYPFFLRRAACEQFRVPLCREGSIPDGFLQIAAGESIVGGRDHDFPSFPRHREFTEEFFLAEFPVTLGEYCAFLTARATEHGSLNDPLDRDGPLDRLIPRFGTETYVRCDRPGHFRPDDRLDPRTPVMAIPRNAMVTYCEWLGGELGREIRLPTEVEWERSARGADGRTFPWGNGFDWALCHGGRSRREAFLAPVGSFREDCSPFGVRDLAGCVRELCAGWYKEKYRPSRGGSWFNHYPSVFRAYVRMYDAEGQRKTDVGFRVAFSR